MFIAFFIFVTGLGKPKKTCLPAPEGGGGGPGEGLSGQPVKILIEYTYTRIYTEYSRSALVHNNNM